MVRLAAQGGNRNLDIHPLTVLSFFKSRCKENLHIILCLSASSSAFRNRLRLYPSFVNCCIIDWFEVIIKIKYYIKTVIVIEFYLF